MHIVIEGMDGVGKSTIVSELSKQLGFEIAQKPLKSLFKQDGDGAIEKILEILPGEDEKDFWAMFLGAAQYYQTKILQNENIIIDRWLPSNFCHYSDCVNEKFFEYLVDVCSKPELTVVLYATPSVRLQRIYNRNNNDIDLVRFIDDDSEYYMIEKFLKKYQMPYIWIDTSNLSTHSVVAEIVNKVYSL